MNCSICNSSKSRVFASWDTFAVQECTDCGFRFIDTSLPGYPEDAQWVYDESKIGEIRPQLPHIQRRANDVVAYKAPPGRALDVGCGKGEVALALSEKSFRSFGIDMKRPVIDYLTANHPRVEWRCAMTHELVELNERFDVITMYHVLEHIPDPKSALATIKALANPGALIVVEVPNVEGLKAKFLGRKWGYYKVDHVNYFRPRDLKSLGEQLGLELLAIRGFQHFSFPQNVLWKDCVKGMLAAIGFKDVVSAFFRVPTTK